jgi:2'-5' RNA ligase
MWFVGASVSFAVDDLVMPEAEGVVATRPADRHLTLAYLGRVATEDVQRVWRALPPLALPERVLALGWERFGRRALALSLGDDDHRLRTAAEACFDAAGAQLLTFERPAELRPHVTLGRVRKGVRPPTPAAMRAWPVPSAPLTLGPPTLFRSRADASPDRYEVVDQQPSC